MPRVLVVDDAVVVRKLVSDTLSTDPDIEVVGVAQNGKIALAKIEQLNPDAITLDIEMPVMDGLETLRELRKTHPKLPVIMFSTLTQRGARATLDALALGASDYVAKPSNVGSVSAGMQRIREELVPKIKALVGVTDPPAPVASGHTAAAKTEPPTPPSAVKPQRIDVVAIGVSTGGPNALAEIFPQFPADFPVPIVLVQHMPPVFTAMLAERLDEKSALQVAEATQGGVVEPGRAWIAAGDYHMIVQRQGAKVVVANHQEPPECGCRPAVDPLFRSVRDVYGAHSLGVILTGMGQDGTRGSQALREAGAQIIAQDEESSVVWGMPGSVTKAGLVEKVLPLGQIVSEIVRRVRRGRESNRQAKPPVQTPA